MTISQTTGDYEYRIQMARAATRLNDELLTVITTIIEEQHDPQGIEVLTLLEAVLTTAANPLERALTRALEPIETTEDEKKRRSTYRDAIDGKFISRTEAEARPDTTVKETREM